MDKANFNSRRLLWP